MRRHGRLALHAPEVEAEAMVAPVAEREVVPRVAAADVEALGRSEHDGIAIGRDRAHAEELPGCELDPAERDADAPSSAR